MGREAEKRKEYIDWKRGGEDGEVDGEDEEGRGANGRRIY